MLYAAAAEAAVLTVAHGDERGRLTQVATVPTVKGARGVIVDNEGSLIRHGSNQRADLESRP
jgi:hypothetical protein